MTPLEIALIVLAVIIGIAIVFNLMKEYRYMKIIESVKTILSDHFGHGEVMEHNQEHPFHVEYKDDLTYLFKVVDLNPNHEVIITNADNVVINKDIKEWKRSSHPHFLPGMKEFLKYQDEAKTLVKVVLIYPDCHNITKYTNESDCYIVKDFEKVDGLYFVTFNKLRDFLKKQ